MAATRLAQQIPAPLHGKAVDFVRQAIGGQLTVDEAVASILMLALEDDSTPAERAAAETASLLARFDAMGGGRDAAGKVARQLSRCPAEQYRIAQRIRKARRRREKNAPGAFVDRGPR